MTLNFYRNNIFGFLVWKLAERMSVDVVIPAKKGHPLSLTSCSREKLHAVEGNMVGYGTGVPVDIVSRATWKHE